ncbi:MAG: very short patch repair endonuclease [Bryobacteraceae bacterium]|jgi:DNA mismatch endonuclease (patch repair protein)
MDKLSPEHRSENMRRIRSTNTSPEMIVRKLVHGMGYRYRLHVPRLPGKPDLVLSRLRRIIEVRGCFWHQHPGCIDSHIPKSRTEYWRPKLKKNQKRDRENEKRLRAAGWNVLTIWECETTESEALVERINAFLRAPRDQT